MVGKGKRARSSRQVESKSDNVASSRTENWRITASSRRHKTETIDVVPANTSRFIISRDSTKLVLIQQEEVLEKEEGQEKAEDGEKNNEVEEGEKNEEEGENNNDAEEEGGDEDGEVDGEEEDGDEDCEEDGDEEEDHLVENDIPSPFESETHFDKRIVIIRQQRDSKGKFMRFSESSSSTSSRRPKKDLSWMLKALLQN